MRLLLLNHIQNARDSLRSNRLRTILTALGVTIGVASITTILALGGGASQVVSRQIDELGGNLAIIRPGSVKEQQLSQLSTSPTHDFAASTLTETDISTVQDITHVEAVAPLMIISGTVRGSSTAPSSSVVVATTPDLALVNNISIRDGQFFDDDTSDTTAVVGAQLSVDLFGTEQSIGRTFTVRGQEFRVIGILKRQDDPINYNGIDFDNAAFITFTQGKVLNRGSTQIQQINIRADSVRNLERVIIDSNKALLSNHQGEADFTVLSGEAIAQPTNQLFYALAGVTATIAAISLFVGGIGIMNIMLVNVAERTREIGIRKALGANQADIVWQFLIESFIIGVIGGLTGCVVGYGAAFLISTWLTFDPVFSWHIIAIALGTAALTGVAFGLYPALKAAAKDPIDSLRHFN